MTNTIALTHCQFTHMLLSQPFRSALSSWVQNDSVKNEKLPFYLVVSYHGEFPVCLGFSLKRFLPQLPLEVLKQILLDGWHQQHSPGWRMKPMKTRRGEFPREPALWSFQGHLLCFPSGQLSPDPHLTFSKVVHGRTNKCINKKCTVSGPTQKP